MILEEAISQLHNGSPLLLLFAGLTIGLAHAFEPDHVSAVSTQVRRLKQRSTVSAFSRLKADTIRNSLLGAFWGLGHTSMILLVSVIVFAFSLNIPSQIFGGFEMIVSLMLIVLGVSVFINKRIFRFHHSHPHVHENGIMHSHPHNHTQDHSHGHKSYMIGCIHGLAGSGSLVAVSISAVNDIQTVLTFALIFGIGSIIGMIIVSGAIGIPFTFLRSKKMIRGLRITTGVISILIGIDIMYGVLNSIEFLSM